jgi:hypothetical protein
MPLFSTELESLFEDEVLLPNQYFDSPMGRSRPPEHRLLWAVLEDAVRGWQVYESATDRKGHEQFSQASAWFASEADDSPFTFVAICQLFHLEPDYVRCGLRRWRERRITRLE